jgi:cyclic pyranopterin phosphate synthase
LTAPVIAATPVATPVRRRPVDAGDGRSEAMPRRGAVVDRFARVHRDLRISITDRCNLRCVYCMPEEGLEFLPRDELLRFDEIARVARVAHDLGIESVRITGGEPLVRAGVVGLVGRLGAIGFGDLALTTNGTSLARLARPLAEAGLHRVNVSCDSLRPERFAAIRRRGDLATVLQAMDAAEAAGLAPLKVNVVLIAGVNDDEVEAFAAFARASGRIVRFIEYMPLDADGGWRREQVVPADSVLERIDARWPLEAVPADGDPAPATRYRFADGAGEIGVVASVTRPFCGTCDRLRLTAEGALRNCLFSDDELSTREVLRAGGDDEALADLVRRAVWAKRPGHGMDEPGFLRPARSMSRIGG